MSEVKKQFSIKPIESKRFLKFDAAVEQWERFTKKESEDEFSRKFKIMKKADYFINPPKKKIISNGEEKLKRFENILYNGYDKPLNRFQREWAVLCIQAALPLIMGDDDWLRYGPNVLKKRKWKRPKKIVVAISTRRIGKTYFKVRFATTISKVKQGIRIAVAATAQRISSEAKGTAKDLCNQQELVILRDNEENIWIENEEYPGDETKATKMGFYPSNPKINLREIDVEEHNNHPGQSYTTYLATHYTSYPFLFFIFIFHSSLCFMLLLKFFIESTLCRKDADNRADVSCGLSYIFYKKIYNTMYLLY